MLGIRMLYFNSNSRKMQMLNPAKPLDDWGMDRVSCNTGNAIFNLFEDGKCVMNVADSKKGNYQREHLESFPQKESCARASIVFIPKSQWSPYVFKDKRLAEAREWIKQHRLNKQKNKLKSIEQLKSGKTPEVIVNLKESEHRLRYGGYDRELMNLKKFAANKVPGKYSLNSNFG